MSTWNLFTGGAEVALICLAAIGFMSVVYVIATAGKKVTKRELSLKGYNKLMGKEPLDK